jgi:prevent-host-death family protein
MGSWAVQDAKARFSELLDTVEESGPQTITKRGVETAVLVPIATWRELNQPIRPNLIDVLMSGPKFEIPIPPRGQHKHRKPVRF